MTKKLNEQINQLRVLAGLKEGVEDGDTPGEKNLPESGVTMTIVAHENKVDLLQTGTNRNVSLDIGEFIEAANYLDVMLNENGAPIQFGDEEVDRPEHDYPGLARNAIFLPPSASSAKTSIANRMVKDGEDINDPRARAARYHAIASGSGNELISLLGEINERLDPKNDDNLALSNMIGGIVDNLNNAAREGSAISDTPGQNLSDDDRSIVAAILSKAADDMDLEAGDSSALGDDDEMDENWSDPFGGRVPDDGRGREEEPDLDADGKPSKPLFDLGRAPKPRPGSKMPVSTNEMNDNHPPGSTDEDLAIKYTNFKDLPQQLLQDLLNHFKGKGDHRSADKIQKAHDDANSAVDETVSEDEWLAEMKQRMNEAQDAAFKGKTK